MKARLEYLAPGIAFAVVMLFRWLSGAEAFHFTAAALVAWVLVLLWRLCSAHRDAERAEAATREERALNARTRQTLNAQTVTIARLQARLHQKGDGS